MATRIGGVARGKGTGGLLKERMEFVSPLHADLFDASSRQSRDPEEYIGQWAREGAPLGMERRIEGSKGIFPPSDKAREVVADPLPELDTMKFTQNYTSIKEHVEESGNRGGPLRAAGLRQTSAMG